MTAALWTGWLSSANVFWMFIFWPDSH